MFAIPDALGMLVVNLLKSRSRLEAESFFLRHQLNIALRRAPFRLRLRRSDRAIFMLMTKLWPSLLVRLRWSVRIRSCGGTVLASSCSGGENREIGQSGRRSIVACAI
jgi:hypothetical protein